MITSGPEFDNFEVKPGMELESFDMKQKDEIFLNHPFKILMFYFRKHPPYYSRWDDIDLSDFYFKMLDDYNRYGISFDREVDLFGIYNKFLYVIKNDNSKKDSIHIKFNSKYSILPANCYDPKTLLFNKVKKICLNDFDKESKFPDKKTGEGQFTKSLGLFEISVPSPKEETKKSYLEWDMEFELIKKSDLFDRNNYRKITCWEYKKRKAIKEIKNKYLQVALMNPKIYNNDEFFEKILNGLLSDYNGEFRVYPSFMFTNEKYDEYMKKRFRVFIDMIKDIKYLIDDGNKDYLGIIS